MRRKAYQVLEDHVCAHGNVNVVKLRSVDSFAYLPKGGLEPFLERGVVEGHREKAACGFAAFDRPSDQMGDVIHRRSEKGRARQPAAVPIGVDPDETGVAGVDLGTALVGVGG